MIVSLNWLKKFTDIDMPVNELAILIGARLVEIEQVINIGAKYKDVLAVKIIESSKLENSDHLNLTKIDDGGITSEIERDENGYIQVVCGAPNVAAGQIVAWLPPKSIVPETFNNPEPFILGSRVLRGVMSNGMIASARELDLFDEHDGILILDSDIKPGTSFASAYELDDYLFDIENKSLTHRPDTFGVIGFAREVAAIQGKKFKTPDWLLDTNPNFGNFDKVSISASIDDANLSNRYQAIVVSGTDSKSKSPLKIQTYLARVGIRPINAVVDVTNYLMLLTGQPLHAFDYDKLVKVGGGKADLHVRAGKEHETLELLDGKKIELTPDDIVIASGDTATALAGAMGGANTAIDETTTNIVIESATFNLYKLRSTQMRHGIFSEAITRFTKGQPAELTAPVLFDAVRLMGEWAGAQCVSNVAEAYPQRSEHQNIQISDSFINNVLGSNFSASDIVKTLDNVEFEIDSNSEGDIAVKSPLWRADINIPEDIVEEVGRLNGFDNIKSILPERKFKAVKPNDFDIFRSDLRKILVRAGSDEILSYSFIHGDIMQKVGLDIKNSYRIINSISPSLQYYRQTLTPSLLDLIHSNIKQGYDEFAIFEINKTHKKQDGFNDENVPIESNALSLIITDKTDHNDSPYYKAKKMFDYLVNSIGMTVYYKNFGDFDDPIFAPFEPKRSACVFDDHDNFLGVVGEYKKSVIKAFKLPQYTAGFEINLESLFESSKETENKYKPISRYPSTERDICFQVDSNVRYSQIIDAINSELKLIDLNSEVCPIDIYQPKNASTKNITIRIKLFSYDKTLSSDEVSNIVNVIAESVNFSTKAIVI